MFCICLNRFISDLQVYCFFRGLIGGTTLVLAVHLVNASLGYAFFVRPPNLPRFSAGATILVKEYGRLAFLFLRGSLIAFCVAVMEELLFRSWLLDEISVDHGYTLAVLISGLSFSLFQRYTITFSQIIKKIDNQVCFTLKFHCVIVV